MRVRLLAFILLSANAAVAEPFTYRTEKVAEGIYAFIEPFGHAVVNGTTVAIVGATATVVVDTGQHPALARAIAAEIRALSPAPVRYVVNTHWHNDHVAGNSEFANEFPHAQFVAHTYTAKMIDDETRRFQGPACQVFLAAQSRPLRDMLKSGLGPGGEPLTSARRARVTTIVSDADAASAECLQFRFRGTDLAFEDRITLRLGNREVEVMYLGPANTAGDAVVWVPDARVVAVGDILVHPFPFAYQSYIAQWAEVLRRIEKLDALAIVPGHGPVLRDKRYLVEVAELMESIDTQVRAAYRPGMSLAETRGHVDLAAFRRRIAGEDPLIGANFDASVAGAAVERAWQAARGRMEPEGLPRS
jgi:cyclase